MWLASLGSGSQGNATLVRADDCCVLIDCGFTRRQFEKRSQRFGLDCAAIDAILVTHEHADHGQGVAAVARHYQIPLWMTVGTARSLGISDYTPITAGQSYQVAGFCIDAVTVPHDAAEPVQFVLTDLSSDRRLGILTDSGHVTPHMISAFAQLDGLLLEFNYDPEMLQNGPYPFSLKRRVGGAHGHLSNQQSLDFLRKLDTARLECLIAGHVSMKNNSPDLVRQLLATLSLDVKTLVACQQQGFEWIEI